ncbi:LysR family transcriptional regulator [Serratia sp. SCBI]|uniref:helix-turn-helix domain-containing protein n=1 Tax=Serratia sp. SCBI TaxID=488142 RepID=UPI000AAA73ED|nr:LysR family transcriptional regulator [Serratia sp. SCBI]
MHFDFIDLRLLAAVLETGSITAGAERVGLSLAAASARHARAGATGRRNAADAQSARRPGDSRR